MSLRNGSLCFSLLRFAQTTISFELLLRTLRPTTTDVIVRYLAIACSAVNVCALAAPEGATSAKIIRAYFLIPTASPGDEADGGVGAEFGAVDGEADAV